MWSPSPLSKTLIRRFSKMVILFFWSTLIIFLKDFLYFQREGKGGRKRGRETSVRCGSSAPNRGMYVVDRESNQQPFGSQASDQSTEPHQLGQFLLWKKWSVLLICRSSVCIKKTSSLWFELLVFFSSYFYFVMFLLCRKMKCMVVEFPVFLGLKDFALYLGFLHLKNIRKFFFAGISMVYFYFLSFIILICVSVINSESKHLSVFLLTFSHSSSTNWEFVFSVHFPSVFSFCN